jgi:hypothetical protein
VRHRDAETLFKRQRDGEQAMVEYTERQEAERRKTERLRALRIAKESEARSRTQDCLGGGVYSLPTRITCIACHLPPHVGIQQSGGTLTSITVNGSASGAGD